MEKSHTVSGVQPRLLLPVGAVLSHSEPRHRRSARHTRSEVGVGGAYSYSSDVHVVFSVHSRSCARPLGLDSNCVAVHTV